MQSALSSVFTIHRTGTDKCSTSNRAQSKAKIDELRVTNLS